MDKITIKKITLLLSSITIGFWPLVFYTTASLLGWKRPFFEPYNGDIIVKVSVLAGALLFGLYLFYTTKKKSKIMSAIASIGGAILFYVVGFYAVVLASFTV